MYLKPMDGAPNSLVSKNAYAVPPSCDPDGFMEAPRAQPLPQDRWEVGTTIAVAHAAGPATGGPLLTVERNGPIGIRIVDFVNSAVTGVGHHSYDSYSSIPSSEASDLLFDEGGYYWLPGLTPSQTHPILDGQLGSIPFKPFRISAAKAFGAAATTAVDIVAVGRSPSDAPASYVTSGPPEVITGSLGQDRAGSGAEMLCQLGYLAVPRQPGTRACCSYGRPLLRPTSHAIARISLGQAEDPGLLVSRCDSGPRTPVTLPVCAGGAGCRYQSCSRGDWGGGGMVSCGAGSGEQRSTATASSLLISVEEYSIGMFGNFMGGILAAPSAGNGAVRDLRDRPPRDGATSAERGDVDVSAAREEASPHQEADVLEVARASNRASRPAALVAAGEGSRPIAAATAAAGGGVVARLLMHCFRGCTREE